MELARQAPGSALLGASLEEWRAALAEMNDVSEIKKLHDLAEAARRFAQSKEDQRFAATAKLWTAHRGGELLNANVKAGNPQLSQDATIGTLADYGIDRSTSSRWQRLFNEIGSERLDRYVSSVEEPTFAGVFHWTDKTRVVSSETNEWYTPRLYVDRARDVLGGIDLDPASNVEANATVQAARFFTAADDGLTHSWKGRVWMNPPYGRIAKDFVAKLVDEYRSGEVTAAVVLVNAHSTDTAWFQPLWDYTLCFTDHRIDFAAGTATRKGSTHGSVFVYLGPEPELFADRFRELGAVVRRWP